mgnify:CR=1 FL=1
MNKQTFFIGTLLPTLNEIIAASKVRRGSWSQYTELKALYGSICKHDIRAAKIQPVRQPVHVTFRWQEKHAQRDPDNIMAGQKFVLDALVILRILAGDGQRDIASIAHDWIVDKAHPGVLVTLETRP